jgi:hypothetical protein
MGKNRKYEEKQNKKTAPPSRVYSEWGHAVVVLTGASLPPCRLLSLCRRCPHIVVVPVSWLSPRHRCPRVVVVPVRSLVFVVPVSLSSRSWLSLRCRPRCSCPRCSLALVFVGIGVVVGVRCPDFHCRQHHHLPLRAVARRRGGGAM